MDLYTFVLSPLQESLLLATLVGLTIPLGSLLAAFENIRPVWLQEEFRHSVIAFGAGILLAAIALVLVPEGMKALSFVNVILCVGGGGIAFLVIDYWLKKQGGAFSQLMAMLLDFIPEAMALGAMLSYQHDTAILLAILIGFQNIPESFNAYREIRAAYSVSKGKILMAFTLLVILGPLSAGFGSLFLSGTHAWLGGIMLFSSGGILYLIFQDISPQVPLKKAWLPPFGAVVGFMVGITGHMLL